MDDPNYDPERNYHFTTVYPDDPNCPDDWLETIMTNVAANTATAIRNVPLNGNHLRYLYAYYPDVLHALGGIWNRAELRYYHGIGDYPTSITMGLMIHPPGCATLPRQQNALEDVASKLTLKELPSLAKYDIETLKELMIHPPGCATLPRQQNALEDVASKLTLKDALAKYDIHRRWYPEDYADMIYHMHERGSATMKIIRRSPAASSSSSKTLTDVDIDKMMKGRKGVGEEQRRRDLKEFNDKLATGRQSMKNHFKVYRDKRTNELWVNPPQNVLKKLGTNAVLMENEKL